jgi:(p)ppGpp synthase/HD superfamily hydrolase
MKLIDEKIEWVIAQHKNTNHMYAEYLPYEYHLRMVVGVFERFKHLVEEIKREDVKMACFAHDTIEDTRVTYNDVKSALGTYVADLVYSLTNEKGKTRKERANDKYYEGIRLEKYGVFVKMCDRIANVEYSKMSGGRMFEMIGLLFGALQQRVALQLLLHKGRELQIRQLEKLDRLK